MEQIPPVEDLKLLSHLTNDKSSHNIKLKRPDSKANDRIHEVLFAQDDITWQTILQDLIKSNEIDPWDIDIGQLTQKYIGMIKQLKEFDFKISGKALLAAAVLLRIKSSRLVGEDLDEFDRIIAGEPEEDFFDEDILSTRIISEEEVRSLIPRLPQPRKRKVTIYDLMGALEKALEVLIHRLFLLTVLTTNNKIIVYLVIALEVTDEKSLLSVLLQVCLQNVLVYCHYSILVVAVFVYDKLIVVLKQHF